MRRLIHISDLHFGRTRHTVLENLHHDILDLQPDLIIVSGDLTQRAAAWQFQDACRFLQSFSFPKLVVPGNHDIPLWNLYMRFSDPLARYRHYISEDLSPFFEDSEISVHGLTTAHGRTVAGGRFAAQDLRRVLSHWKNLSTNILRVLVSHHPFESLTSNKRIGKWGYRIHHPEHEDIDIAEYADLILSGHFHEGGAFPTEQVFLKPHRSVVAIQAGTAISSRLRGEANSYNVIEASTGEIHFEKRIFNDEMNRFETLTDKNFFLKNDHGWKDRSVHPQFL